MYLYDMLQLYVHSIFLGYDNHLQLIVLRSRLGHRGAQAFAGVVQKLKKNYTYIRQTQNP